MVEAGSDTPLSVRSELEDLLSETRTGADGNPQAVENLKDRLGIDLPPDYQEFLIEANGCAGEVGATYLDLWSVEQIPDLNDGYAVSEFLPGALLIGTDGADTAYGLVQTEAGAWEFMLVPFIGMGPDQVVPLGESFVGFLNRISSV